MAEDNKIEVDKRHVWVGILSIVVFITITIMSYSHNQDTNVTSSQIRIEALQKTVDDINKEIVTKDVIEPRLSGIERSLEQLRVQLSKQNDTLEQVLLKAK